MISKRQISNQSSDEMTVIIEPYGDVLTLPSGGSIDIVAESSEPGEIETVSDGPLKVTIYTWPGSTCAVYQGSKVIKNYSLPVPGVPEGITTRRFLDLSLREKRGSSTADPDDDQ
jgi:hypothetical protein